MKTSHSRGSPVLEISRDSLLSSVIGATTRLSIVQKQSCLSWDVVSLTVRAMLANNDPSFLYW